MDISRIDLNLLATLEVLISERNVTKAAARLHLSQPAVSAQLNRLRDLFGDPLLIPAHRGMIPTAKALALMEPLRQSLDQLRDTLQSHDDFSPARAELIVAIACTDYVQAAVVMPLVLALREKAPGVRVAVRNLNPALLDQQLAAGDVDLAIATPKSDQPHLRTRRLFDETYVLIGRRDHPGLEAGLTVEQFVALEHVIVSPSGGGFASPIDEALAALGHRRKIVMSAASFLFVPEIVSMSDLVALAPRRLLRGRQDRLSCVELAWLTEQFAIDLIWHERNNSHPGQRWIRELIVELTAPTEKTEPPAPARPSRPRKTP
ncbi:Nodulation+protein+D+2 [Methylocapsa aurea]|uniref:LysR family transcriptional regulator n=1 Tax=Methylocapsa aurea TaxID=663610 RepID=UPI003D188E7C